MIDSKSLFRYRTRGALNFWQNRFVIATRIPNGGATWE